MWQCGFRAAPVRFQSSSSAGGYRVNGRRLNYTGLGRDCFQSGSGAVLVRWSELHLMISVIKSSLRAVLVRLQCGLGHLMIKGWWNAPGVTAWKWDKMAPDSLTTRGPTHTLHTHTHTHMALHTHTHTFDISHKRINFPSIFFLILQNHSLISIKY